MEEVTYKITLADGTEIKDLKLNGNNYISKAELTEETFDGNLSSVTITGSDGSEKTLGESKLVQIMEHDGEYWFILQEYSQDELTKMKNRADIEYIAAMASIDLD